MSPDEFRRHGHRMVDWVADYLSHPEQYPVLPKVTPGALIDKLPSIAPEMPEPMEAIFADFRSQIIPAITHWNHPGFMGYFATSALGPGILGDLLSSALSSNCMFWNASPAGTELEQVTLDWLRQWMGLPDPLFGIIYDTASTSTMHAIAAAREAVDPAAREKGGSHDLILYTSEHAHSSVEKSALAIGIGQRNVRKIAVDADFRMRPDALVHAIEQDRVAGRRPFCVVPSVGTTSTSSIDPVPAVAAIAERFGLWLHVDAAYGGAAAIVPEHRHVLDGAVRADSLVVNPHKWLGIPFDLSVLYTRKPEILRRAFSLIPVYLKTADDPRAVNYMDYGVPLGRRFRALKLWFTMRYYGRQALAARIASHIEWARELAKEIAADDRFEICAPTPFSLVCFRLKANDERNRQLLEDINESGEVLLSQTVLRGKFVLRLAIGNHSTTRQHVRRAWDIVQACARD